MGKVRDIAFRAREIALMVVTAGIVFFAWQNLRSEQISFFFWDFHVPVALMALVPLLIGLVVGSAGTAIVLQRRSRRARRKAEQEAEPAQLEPPTDLTAGARIKDEEEIPG
jgi:uncharacterized integral membrane protein